MSKRELWEIVRADELKVGDVIVDEVIFDDDDDFGLATIGEIRHTETRVFYRYKNGSGTEYSLAKKSDEGCILRRIPDADDPRVLMRALEMAVNEIEARDRYGTSPNPKEKDFIDQARREFESEASDE